MKLTPSLFKSRWQSADAAVRRASVENDDAAELIEALPRLARSDADARVRLAALRRLADPGVAQSMANDDPDRDVRSAAQALWLDLLAGVHPAAPPLDERLRLLRGQDSPELIDHIARHASEPALRAAALARVERASLLAERALGDPDPALRIAALERITDEGLLGRIAERARKSDKQINQRARIRLDALRIARNDDTTVNSRARELCERLEDLIRTARLGQDESEIARQWQTLAGFARPDLAERYAAACALLAASRNPVVASGEPALPAAADAASLDAAQSDDEESVPSPTQSGSTDSAPEMQPPAKDADEVAAEVEALEVEALAAQTRFHASIAAARATAAREHEQLRERFEQALAQFEQALDSGKAALAHAAHAQVVNLRKIGQGELPRSSARRLSAAEQRYAEVSQWQRWGDNQRRHQLCEEMRALPAAGLHPDAIATKVREARAEWLRLDQMEGSTDARAARGLGSRFNALCRHALEPAKPYFEKRQELRTSAAQTVAALLAQISELPVDNTDWRAISGLRQQAATALNNLDQVDPRERKLLAKDIKGALDRLDAVLNAHYAGIEQAKAALIAEADGLTGGDARRTAAGARALQQRWQAVGNGRRGRDQSQWKAFRGALDAAFARLDAERSEVAARALAAREQADARNTAAREEASAICAELEALAKSGTAASRAAVAALESRWKTLDLQDAAFSKRFGTAQTALREAAAGHARQARRARFNAWLARYRLCCEAQNGVSDPALLRARWLETSDSAAAVALTLRFDNALRGDTPQSENESPDAARDLLVRMEALAGLESPAEDRQRRLDQQVARLSAHLRGEDRMGPAQQLELLLEAWSAVRLPGDASALDQRLERALNGILANLP